jgi:hypothetical protein
MTRLMLAMLFAATLLVAACSQDHDHDDKDGHSHDNGHSHSNGHSHDHGEEHALGHVSLDGGYHVGASRMGDLESGKEGVFEIHVSKDDKDVSDANVTAWLGGEDGGHTTRPANCNWMSSEDVYDAHIMIPAELPAGTKLWVRIRHNDADLTTSFSLTGN